MAAKTKGFGGLKILEPLIFTNLFAQV